MILVVDNYDSFTYNLVQALGELGAELQVYRNDEIDVDSVRVKAPTGIVMSPARAARRTLVLAARSSREWAPRCRFLGSA